MESQERTPRIAQTIVHFGHVSVRHIDHRTHSILRFHAIGIQFGLLLALLYADTGTLGFHDSQRTAIGSKEYIVGKAFSATIGHPFYLHFDASLQRDDGSLLVQYLPTGFL